MAHACRISSQKTLSYREVSQFMGSLNWASGLIPPGHLHLRPLQHFHSLGSNKPFFNTQAFRPCSPCYPTQAVAEPIVSHIRNPYLTFPGRVHHFHRRLDPGLDLVVDLFLWLQTQDITLRARHILGCRNVIADRLSRTNQPIMTEWSLHPEVMNLIFRLWRTPVVDRFATAHNTHLPQFMALVPESLEHWR